MYRSLPRPLPRSARWLPVVLLASCAALCGRAGGAEPEVDAPLPPDIAAQTMLVPHGFRVTLFAGEPDVQQPISFCLDDRGRLWVAEAYNYPQHGTRPGDRILIFEDQDGDGHFDRRTVFYDQLNYVTGIEVGFGGAWVVSPPYFYFLPDRDGDDRPDGPPQVLLDGFGTHANSHNLANALAWGPDGWLYGTHGRTNWSLLGKPGTPDAQRQRFDGGVYRYHPTRHVWEPYADGTTNPWGIDWDDYGEGFVCNCVNPHLFHVIQGAHYEPWRNRASSLHAYERIASIADHQHFVGEANVRDGLGSAEEDAAGGGHAHCGTMVYLGDNWPDEYRNAVYMHNIHGKRINCDRLQRSGSGYTALHGRDIVRSRDPWFMGVTLKYGPDGGVYSSDWSDTGECHSVKNTRRHTGRIFKITYGTPQTRLPPLARLSPLELVELQLHRNDWYVQHARRLLQEQAAAGQDLSAARQRLETLFATQTDVPRQLRALWALHVIGGLTDDFLVRQLEHASEYIRGWAVRLLCEDGVPPPAALTRFVSLAAQGDSAYVRLQLSSALQRLPPAQRWDLAAALAARAEDAADPNLPLMIWYGIEPLVDTDLARFLSLAETARLPLVRRHVARRAAVLPRNEAALEQLTSLLARLDDDARREVLAGIRVGLEGRRQVPRPAPWATTYPNLQQSPDAEVREAALELALVFDDPAAFAQLQRQAAERQTDAATRNRALRSLLARRPAGVDRLLLQLVDDPATRQTAIRGLAEYPHADTPTVLLTGYRQYDAATRQDALQTLASRAAWAHALLDAIEKGQIPRGDVTAYTARQLQSLADEQVRARVRALWGELRTTRAAAARRIADVKKRLTPTVLKSADRAAGRAVFQMHCANCHKLFDAGGQIGPELTGAQRFNLDYLLENLGDPSAAVSKDFQLHVIETTDGRVVTGMIAGDTDRALTVQTVNERLVIPRGEIAERTASPLSLMPEGVLDKLTFEQLRDLIAYLGSPAQVPLP